MYRVLLGPALSLLTLAAVAVAGGAYNSAEARGKVFDDWTNEPLAAEIRLGSRIVKTNDDGTFDVGLVPRGSRLNARKPGYAAADFDAGQPEVRLTPVALTLRVVDKGGNAIPFPEARKQNQVIGRGTESGSMVLAPHPGRDVSFLICAAGLEPIEFAANEVSRLVRLQEKGDGCPPLPGQSPSPAPRPSPSPSPTP